MTQALQISQDIGDKVEECRALFNIGHNHSQNGEQREALSIWLEAYKIVKQIGDAQALDELGGEGLDWLENGCKPVMPV